MRAPCNRRAKARDRIAMPVRPTDPGRATAAGRRGLRLLDRATASAMTTARRAVQEIRAAVLQDRADLTVQAVAPVLTALRR